MPDTVRVLMGSAVDYAGLFPPARLAMRDAVERYASYRSSPHAWMLGRFVVQASRLAEFADAAEASARGDSAPWPLSALLDEVDRDVSTVSAFNRDHAWAQCDVVEARAASASEVTAIATAVGTAITGMTPRAYVEVRIDVDPSPLIQSIAGCGLNAKVRTGGIVATAIPRSEDIARFLGACVRAGVPFKATAGLHHPMKGEYRLTYEPDSATAAMYGYLNVFLAAALLFNGAAEHDAIRLLDERDASSLQFGTAGITWREHFIPAAVIATFRQKFLAGFGSCSFTEPVDEIIALGFV